MAGGELVLRQQGLGGVFTERPAHLVFDNPGGNEEHVEIFAHRACDIGFRPVPDGKDAGLFCRAADRINL